ncbi:methuselah n-terminal domain superfamily [Holotrichia oblita]|uniref:Methuselah n-terminal domain superfamily n=1 Tax=Holotrichia oblita TaxID=644536 RepID=A0ACB9T1T8_HOLOL|nr:methuselah n-terminal domain superfamily [Holotrichia oblita]
MIALRTIFGAFCLVTSSYAAILSSSGVSKCCLFNETLTAKQQCESTNRTDWENSYRYMNDTTSPSYVGFGPWTLIENKVPNCEKWLAIPTLPLSVIIQGLLYTATLDKFFPPSQYCVDMDYVLVCDNIFGNKTLVNRCCDSNAIYSNETKSCKEMEEEKEIFVGNNVYFKHLVPCNQIMSIAIVSNETILYENGSLEVMGHLYPHESFCLEYMSQNGK